TYEELQERHPRLLPALRDHLHVGWLLVNSAEHGGMVLGRDGMVYLDEDRVEGESPLALFSPTAAQHLKRTNGFAHAAAITRAGRHGCAHAADIPGAGFYARALDESCAFEELFSFHGGLGGPQTEAFLLYPQRLSLPDEPIRGAESVHRVLLGWRAALNDAP